MDANEIICRFTYHKPVKDQPERYQEIRNLAGGMAAAIIRMTPESREQSLAITAIEEAVFWANAAIARREK